MKLGRVAGTVVSPISHPFFDGQRLLLCDEVNPVGEPTGRYLIAVNVVDAGVGDNVLICDEGTSARQIFGIDTGPIRSVIVGIVDHVDETDPR
ncbi:MAG: EutN/CcmL family microcompartment protein [Acidimicrobiales bacterium]